MMRSMTRRSMLGLGLTGALLTLVPGCNPYGEKLTFGKGEVFYKEPVKKEEAEKLGKFLKDEVEFFDDTTQRSVQLLKDGSTYKVRFVVKEGVEKEDNTKAIFELMASGMSAAVFDGAPVQVELCNDRLETVKALDAKSASSSFAPPKSS
jgi:hypothetical protein